MTGPVISPSHSQWPRLNEWNSVPAVCMNNKQLTYSSTDSLLVYCLWYFCFLCGFEEVGVCILLYIVMLPCSAAFCGTGVCVLWWLVLHRPMPHKKCVGVAVNNSYHCCYNCLHVNLIFCYIFKVPLYFYAYLFCSLYHLEKVVDKFYRLFKFTSI